MEKVKSDQGVLETRSKRYGRRRCEAGSRERYSWKCVDGDRITEGLCALLRGLNVK